MANVRTRDSQQLAVGAEGDGRELRIAQAGDH
jgi:hypothetical protein